MLSAHWLAGRAQEWGRRYLPLEVAATLTALAGGLLASLVTSHGVAVAYAGAWAENVGYYGYAFWREMRARTAASAVVAASDGSSVDNASVLARLVASVRALAWEFGAAELIDSFVARPFCMYWGMALTGHLGVGIVAGKLAADVLFYAIAIVFYELGKPGGRDPL